jgi:signal transduction histidine kinase
MQLRWDKGALQIDVGGAEPARPSGLVLVVDENPVVLKVMSLQLEDWGYGARIADSHEAGLAAVDPETVEAVIANWHLGGGKGGPAFLTALRKRAPQTPVIILVSSPSPAEVITAMRAGAFDYIVLQEVPFVRRVVYWDASVVDGPDPLQAAVRKAVNQTRLLRYGAELNRQLAHSNEELARERTQLMETLAELKRAQNKLLRVEKAASMAIASRGVANAIMNPLAVLTTGLQAVGQWVRRVRQEQPSPRALAEEAELDEVFREIDESVERIRDTMNAMRKFATWREVSWQPVFIEAVFDDLVKHLPGDLRGDSEIEVECALDDPLRGNRAMLQEALSCILSNAAEACAELADRSAAIRLCARSDATSAFVEVIDNGPGIAADDLDHIFDLFWTTRLARNARGMGLPTAHEIVMRLGGEITVTSELDKGTTVSIELGLWSDSDEQTAEAGAAVS